VGGVKRLIRLVQGIVEPRRNDRRVDQRRLRAVPVERDRRAGGDRRARERRAAF
jgi:hypothetical protein